METSKIIVVGGLLSEQCLRAETSTMTITLGAAGIGVKVWCSKAWAWACIGCVTGVAWLCIMRSVSMWLFISLQLARKHPERGWAVGAGCVPGDAPSILSSAPHRDLPDAASPSTAGPRRMSQRAPSGARGVFVRRCMPTDGLTDRVMGLYDDFATTAFCCGYPPWFYTAWSVAGLIPLIKQPLSDAARARGDDPDCRPVAVGSATA